MVSRCLQRSMIILLSLSSATTSLFAEDYVPSTSVTLHSVTEAVYKQHPSQQQLVAREQQVKANKDLANALFAGASTVNLSHNNDVIGSDNGYQEWEGGVALPLWLPGQKQQQQRLADNLKSYTSFDQQKIKLESSALVRQVVWDIALADTAMQYANKAWNNAKKLQQDVESRVKAGELPHTELLLASTNVLALQGQYIQAQAQRDLALARYQQVTGQTEVPSELEETLPAQFAASSGKSSELTVSKQHPLLAAFDQHIAILLTQQQLARFDSSVNPNLSIGMRSERNASGEDFENSVGIGIEFAFDNNVYSQPAVANAASALAEVEVDRQALQRQLDLALLTEYHKLNAIKKQYTLLVEQNTTTQQYLRLQQKAFDLGEIDLATLLRSRSLAQQTENEMQLLAIQIKQQVANVNQSLGIIL